MKNKILLFVFCLFCFSVLFAQKEKTSNPDTSNQFEIKEIRTGGFEHINPLLDYYEIYSSSLKYNKLLQKKITTLIQDETRKKNITAAAVYYRDLTNGPWIGVNENEVYSPASLLKVPYLLSALKQAEQDPGFLEKRIIYTKKKSTYIQNIIPGNYLIPGNSYTINELLYFMIVYSDNAAKDMIVKEISDQNYYETFDELGINIAKYDTLNVDFLSVKEYASFFRVLFNATFLSKQMSEAALTLLTKTEFIKGIVAGVPQDIEIAHKFGERSKLDSGLKQLHDCGIIYKKNQPYILCIMTKGNDFKKMETVISGISKLVYEHLDKFTNNSKNNNKP